MALVQSGKNKTSTAPASSVVVTMPGNTTPGNLLVISVLQTNLLGSNISSIVNGASSAGLAKEAVNGAANGCTSSIWYKHNIAGGSATVTVTFSVATNAVVLVDEWNGFSTTDSLGNTASATGSSRTAQSGSVSAAALNNLVVACMGHGSHVGAYGTPTSSFTESQQDHDPTSAAALVGGISCYRDGVVAASYSTTSQISSGDDSELYAGVIVAFGIGTTYTEVMSGGFTLTGTFGITSDYVEVMSGGFTLTGTFGYSNVYIDEMSGGVSITATVGLAQEYSDVMSGGFVVTAYVIPDFGAGRPWAVPVDTYVCRFKPLGEADELAGARCDICDCWCPKSRLSVVDGESYCFDHAPNSREKY